MNIELKILKFKLNSIVKGTKHGNFTVLCRFLNAYRDRPVTIELSSLNRPMTIALPKREFFFKSY